MRNGYSVWLVLPLILILFTTGCGPGGPLTPGNATPAPTITDFTPSAGLVGAEVTITGTNLSGVTAVQFNGVAASTVTNNTATSLKALVPSGALTGKISITTSGGMVTSAGIFTVSSSNATPGTNPIDGATLVWIPANTFTMGTEYGEIWWWPHSQRVTLSGYWIYKYEVTVAQYRTFCAATGHVLRAWPGFFAGYSWEGKSGWTDPAIQQHPMVNVTWDDCKAYAAWAGVSLPTEAQWEYAARGPQGRNYPWGGTANSDNPYDGWDQTKSANYWSSYMVGISTWPVGSFPAGASWCGAQDLAGNVGEWCSDWSGNYSSVPVTNPTGPSTGSSRILRGGSWFSFGSSSSDYSYGRGAFRTHGNPGFYGNNLGFRCVSSAPGP